ncbi:MAG: hypothetical protein C0513_03000 [Isosphaera sp.]|nr:hypothetical protein [Isosphaera sp.]
MAGRSRRYKQRSKRRQDRGRSRHAHPPAGTAPAPPHLPHTPTNPTPTTPHATGHTSPTPAARPHARTTAHPPARLITSAAGSTTALPAPPAHGPARWPSPARLLRLQALRSRWRSLRPALRRTAQAVAVAGAAAVVLLVVAWNLAAARPGWWRALSAGDPALLERAQGVENGATTLLSEPHPIDPASGVSEVWSVSLSDEDATAWLVGKLPRWAVSRGAVRRWPAEIAQLQVRFERGRIAFGAEVVHSGTRRYFVARLRPRVDRSGALWTPAVGASVGRLPIPAGLLLSSGTLGAAGRIPDEVAQLPQTDGLLRALTSAAPLVRSPVIRLPDGRRVRLVGLRVEPGALVMDLRTEPAAPASAGEHSAPPGT